MKRRSFLKTLGAASAAGFLHPSATKALESATARVAALSPEEAAADESYWRDVQGAFSISRSLIDLNNGFTCPSPKVVTDSVVDYIWQQEEAPSYVIARLLPPRVET